MIVFTCSRLIGVIDAQIVPTGAMNKIVRVVGGTVSRDNSSHHQPLIKVTFSDRQSLSAPPEVSV